MKYSSTEKCFWCIMLYFLIILRAFNSKFVKIFLKSNVGKNCYLLYRYIIRINEL